MTCAQRRREARAREGEIFAGAGAARRADRSLPSRAAHLVLGVELGEGADDELGHVLAGDRREERVDVLDEENRRDPARVLPGDEVLRDVEVLLRRERLGGALVELVVDRRLLLGRHLWIRSSRSFGGCIEAPRAMPTLL
jgi:hypothetical protein